MKRSMVFGICAVVFLMAFSACDRQPRTFAGIEAPTPYPSQASVNWVSPAASGK